METPNLQSSESITPADNDKPKTLNPESIKLMQGFIEIQTKELGLREQEMTLQSRGMDKAHEYALEALNAQKTDRVDERNHSTRTLKIWFAGVGIFVLLLFSFLGLCLYMGNEKMAMAVLSHVGVAVASFIGGYGARTAKESHQDSTEK